MISALIIHMIHDLSGTLAHYTEFGLLKVIGNSFWHKKRGQNSPKSLRKTIMHQHHDHDCQSVIRMVILLIIVQPYLIISIESFLLFLR